MSHGIQMEAQGAAKQRKADQQRSSGHFALSLSDQPTTGTHKVALLTGGGDKPYVLGLTRALNDEGLFVEVVGSDALSVPELLDDPKVEFLNLRGDQRSEAHPLAKTVRVVRYYGRLLRYAAGASPKVFHILWHNKFEYFDRTVLLLYYRVLGKRVVLTAHNVNAAKRDGNDSFCNRLSLKILYRLCGHIFVHTEKMRHELRQSFGVAEKKISVIPFGINKTARETKLSSKEAKNRIGIAAEDKTLLFFGQIAPYKGLEFLISAFEELINDDRSYRLIIAGRPKWSGAYWAEIKRIIAAREIGARIVERIEHIPDDETEVYFKAADVLILPYKDIFQSGVLFLGYNFGLPAVATDVGSLKEEIVEGKTGFVCRPEDSSDLAATIRRYFTSSMFFDLERQRPLIKEFANERYSWSKVATATRQVYDTLLGGCEK